MPSDPAFREGAAFMDGAYMPVGECRIPILDWGFLRGDATYDVVHTWQGRFFRLEEHLDRFTRNLGRLHYDIPYDRDGIAEVLHRCVALAGLEDAFVEMLVTRGIPRNRDPRQSTNRFAVFAVPFVWILPQARHHDDGLRVIVSSIERIRSQAVDPTVKNYHWLDLVRGLFEAYEQGGETAVLVDARGNVLEGPGFNLFVLRDGVVATPDSGVLEGVTRATAIELLQRRGVEVQLREVHADELRGADEAFATSTAGGVMPIASVDGRPLGGRPVTSRLLSDYWAAHADPAWTTPVRRDLAEAAPA
jgi:branched-subunit amino acid aminotransferase/4-amino-4-deoxychorismate lyase